MSVSTSPAKPIPPAEPTDGKGVIPPLKSGDRLTRDEFERRYDAMPNLRKAELIEGVVYVPSPVRQRHHSEPHFSLIGWLFSYSAARTPGLVGGDNASVRLALDNRPQPDCLLFIAPECGGQARIDDDDYVNGAPDLVAEVAASTAMLRCERKARSLPSPWRSRIHRLPRLDREIDWFVLREGRFRTAGSGGRRHPPQHDLPRTVAGSSQKGNRLEPPARRWIDSRPAARSAARLLPRHPRTIPDRDRSEEHQHSDGTGVDQVQWDRELGVIISSPRFPGDSRRLLTAAQEGQTFCHRVSRAVGRTPPESP